MEDVKPLRPAGFYPYPVKPVDVKVEKINAVDPNEEPFDYLKEKFMGITQDKITTVTGVTAAVCTGLLFSGVLVPATAAYIAVVSIGTISGGIFAWFTKGTNPFVKPPEVKK